MVAVIFTGHLIPFTLGTVTGIPATGVWTVILLIYACIASILPVQALIQPRDFKCVAVIHCIGVIVLWGVCGRCNWQLTIVAPAVVSQPEGAPSMMPFLFITIACGAISGFHSLVASGTTSKQLNRETMRYRWGMDPC